MSLLLLALLCSLKLYSQTNDLKTDFSNFELLIKEGKIKEAWANGEAYLAQIPKNNRLQQAETNYLLGKIAHKQKEDSLANIFLGSAAALLDNNCESECVLFARTHDLLGVSFYRAGNYVKSRLHLEQALRVWLSFPLIDSLSTANTMLNLGKTVRYLDEFTRAIELFGQARAMGERFQKQGFKVMLTYMFTGNVHYLRDQYAEAEAAYSKALEIERSAPVMRPRAVIALTNNLAATLDLRGRLKQAIDRYQEVLLLSKELYGPNDVRTISIYSNIGLVYQRMKNGGMAERYYAQACSRAEKALGADHPVTAQVFEEYASLAWNNGDSKLALERAQIALYASAPTISRKDYHENPALKDVINLEQFRSTIEFKGRILFHTADTTANPQAQLQFALACYELYMEAMDQVWQGFSDPGDKVYLNQNGLNAYEEAIRCAAKLFQLTKDSRYQEKIFDYMERGKFQVMLESIQRSRAAYLAGIPLDLRKQTEALRELVNTLGFRLRQKNQSSDSSTSLRNELLEVQLKLSHLTDSLKSAFPAFEQMTGQRSRLSFTTLVDQYTNAEMALIEYFLADSSLFVMTGHPSGVQFREVKLKPGFRDSLLSFAGLLQSPDPGRAQLLHYQQLAFSLYQTLIAPELMALPKSVKRLRIIPDDLLSLLPFDALLSDSSPENPRNHGELPFLIYKYQVSYAASAA
ncbi:MAG TPA: tetratricopeptide repeat protein, partial [Bacteroidetes bacterium]|nr:tetratricopeptide repeat protein [Bacteroidota bacterium]